MYKAAKPSIFILILMVSLGPFGDTIYAPALPELKKILATDYSHVQLNVYHTFPTPPPPSLPPSFPPPSSPPNVPLPSPPSPNMPPPPSLSPLPPPSAPYLPCDHPICEPVPLLLLPLLLLF